MNLLSIDTSSPVLYAAICYNDIIYCSQSDTGMRQSELFIEIIDNLMKKASMKTEDLHGVLCTAGPGSFTGLRIGYSAAKSLALALSIPFAPVPTLDCIVSGISSIIAGCNTQSEKTIIMPLIQARKNSFFYALFNEDKRISEDKEMSLKEIEEEIINMFNINNDTIFITGPASSLFNDSLSAEIRKENIIKTINNESINYAAEAIAIAIKRKLLDNDNTAYLYSGPAYLRLTDAEAALTR